MPVLDTVVFDVGRVLIDFSFEGFKQFLDDHGATLETPPEFIEKTDLRSYERGDISSRTFIKNIIAHLTVPVPRRDIINRFRHIFSPNQGMLELLESLKQDYRVYLLSNTNELHWKYLEREYQLVSRAHGAVTSFEERCSKPDAAIYQALETKFGIVPEKAVFIDDIAEHVEAAAKRKWHGIVHQSLEQTKEQLHSLGVTAKPK